MTESVPAVQAELAVKNRIIKNELVDIDRLTPFQGNLKVLDDKRFNKLRKSLVDEGFSFTVHVWENGDVIYIIDGHQRVSVLTQMRKQGYEVPPINCAFISARTYHDAKKLVLLAVSQYGKIQKEGFADFVSGEDFDFDDFDFPDLTFDLADLSFEPPAEPEPEPENQPADRDEPESNDDPVDDFDTKPPQRVNFGEVWRLGSHTLVCGDSGNASLVHRVIGHESADCILSDPPYGLSFMGKDWDKGVPSQQLWETWNSRLKPGAHVLSFSGTRTYHLMTINIENAGFEIRDMMQWIYGQGFPKSHDISKAIDKDAGHWRGKAGAVVSSNGAMSGGNYERTEKGDPITPEAQKWNGWGTALKPANEPICVAQKPISEKTIAANVLKHGTGGLNIDGTRISTEGQDMGDPNRFKKAGTAAYLPISKLRQLKAEGHTSWGHVGNIDAAIARAEKLQEASSDSMAKTAAELGRFPANVIFDEAAAEVLDRQSGESKSAVRKIKEGGETVKPGSTWTITSSGGLANRIGGGFEDSGGASRFFYVAKPSKSEKGKENHHATVKPVSLMQYLVRMVSQPDGLVLEPFAGSGTTLLACEKEGMNCIAFELDPLHCDIILSRWEKLTGEKAVLLSGGEQAHETGERMAEGSIR